MRNFEISKIELTPLQFLKFAAQSFLKNNLGELLIIYTVFFIGLVAILKLTAFAIMVIFFAWHSINSAVQEVAFVAKTQQSGQTIKFAVSILFEKMKKHPILLFVVIGELVMSFCLLPSDVIWYQLSGKELIVGVVTVATCQTFSLLFDLIYLHFNSQKMSGRVKTIIQESFVRFLAFREFYPKVDLSDPIVCERFVNQIFNDFNEMLSKNKLHYLSALAFAIVLNSVTASIAYYIGMQYNLALLGFVLFASAFVFGNYYIYLLHEVAIGGMSTKIKAKEKSFNLTPNFQFKLGKNNV